MKKSISNNKKSPVNTNDNKDEVSIDVNLLLNDPKSLRELLFSFLVQSSLLQRAAPQALDDSSYRV